MTTSSRSAWVSPAGSDAADGSRAHPFAGLHRAVAFVASQSQAGVSDELVIELDAGLYRLDRPASVGPHTSGRRGAVTVIRGNGVATLTGCIPATPYALSPDDPYFAGASIRTPEGPCHVMAIDIPARVGVPLDLGTFGFKMPLPHAPPMIIRRGRRLPWARWPARPHLTGWIVPPLHADDRAGVTLRLDQPLDIPDLHQSSNLWIEMVLGDAWQWYMARVTEIDAPTGRIVTSLTEKIKSGSLRATRIGFLNTPHTLGDTTSCVLDPTRSRIVYLERTDIAPEAIELCVNPAPLFHLTDAAHVRLEGLHLRGGLAGAIVGERCEDIDIVDCRIDQFGFAGIDLSGRRLRIENCHVSDVGTGGIRMFAGNPATLEAGNASINGCRIADWGQWKPIYEPGIRLQGVGIEVAECELTRGPHAAIDVDGNDHTIRRNIISDVAREFADMGAIYFNLGESPLKRGTVIDANAFHSIGGRHALTHAVYFDQATCGVKVTRNLFFHIAGKSNDGCTAVFANGPSDLVVAENLFAECAIALDLEFYLAADWGVIDLDRMRAAWVRTIEMLAEADLLHRHRYPELERFADEDLVFPRTNRFVNNVIWNAACPLAPFGPWRVRSGAADLVEIAGNVAVSKDPVSLKEPHAAVARLIAGRSAVDATRAIEHALADWRATCTLLGLV